MTKSNIAISVLVLLIVLLAVSIAYFVWNNAVTQNPQSPAKELDNAMENNESESVSVFQEVSDIVDSLGKDGMSPEKVLSESNKALDMLAKVGQPADSLLFTKLYTALIPLYENTENSSSTRSDAVLAMNKVAYLSYFDVVPINEALKAFENGRLYEEFMADEHTSDTPVGIAYKAWYHFNIQNYTFNIKDPYFAGFAIWTIALSLIANEPEDEWRDDFISYIVNGYDLIWPDQMDTQIARLDQVLWLQNTLLISRLRLESIYGTDIAYTRDAYEKRFQRIIDQAKQQDDATIEPLAKLGKLIMLKDKNAPEEEITLAVNEFIAVADKLGDAWFSSRLRTTQNEQGYLLQELFELAQTNEAVKIFLKEKGWRM